MPFTEGSHRTRLVNCFFRSSTMSCGFVPALTGKPVAFMYTEHFGGFMLGNISSRTLPSFSWAVFIRGVWKPPDAFSTLTCRAPALSDRSLSAKMAFSVPPTTKPWGKSCWEIWHTAPPPSLWAASEQSSASLGLSRPATVSVACLVTTAASCMTSPLSFTSFSPSSKERTPAAVRAVYSPSDRPAVACGQRTASSRSPLSFSRPAKPAMYTAG
mmetsp:Transcript_43594/g.100853  ORF Transcript_43594/g.100853 Transcript_43594/m.100853 type:complete len:214 (+) Transcript_43594:83-724(+)